jgi:cytochrome c biogenesis protein CcmG/thiol:disulfide interchange protein DsbE
MKKLSKIAILVLLVGVVLTAAACSGSEEVTEEPSGPPAPGKLAPAFELESLAGETVSLADYRGHPVMLNFWATWCGPCQMEMPVFEWLARNPDWQAEDIVILAVNQGESPALVSQFVDVFGITFPVLLDADYAVSIAYNIRGLPTTFFIDKDGIIREIKIGAIISTTDLEARLNDLISAE